MIKEDNGQLELLRVLQVLHVCVCMRMYVRLGVVWSSRLALKHKSQNASNDHLQAKKRVMTDEQTGHFLLFIVLME